MTESEWKLSKELAQMKMMVAQVTSQLCQRDFNEARAQDLALGEKWPGEPESLHAVN